MARLARTYGPFSGRERATPGAEHWHVTGAQLAAHTVCRRWHLAPDIEEARPRAPDHPAYPQQMAGLTGIALGAAGGN